MKQEWHDGISMAPVRGTEDDSTNRIQARMSTFKQYRSGEAFSNQH